MPTSLKTKIFLIASGLAIIFLFVKTTVTEAASTSSLRGWAWFGQTDGLNDYLSFDCADDVIGDLLDVGGNLHNYPEPRGFHFYAVPCSTLEHNVSISPNGNFVGKAWNNALGLVSFNGSAVPPDNGYSLNSHCPYTCNSSNSCWACYSTTTQEVYGWARVDNTSEWINLHPATSSQPGPVMLQDWDTSRLVLPTNLNISPGDFIGYATSTSGRNFSFNCESEIVGGNCTDQTNLTKVPYKVYVGNVQVGYMSAPNWSYTQACATGNSLTANLTWRTRSGEQAAYEIVVNDSDGFDIADGNYICWSRIKYNGSARQYTIPNSNDPDCGSLDYNKNYYWWIKVYSQDNEGNYIPSDWYQFGNGVAGGDNSMVPNGVPKTFLTYSHRFPSPFFTWPSGDVNIGTTTFTSTSSYYDIGNVQNNCNGYCRYEWSTIGDPGAEIYATTSAITSILFTTATNTSVILKVTDLLNYYCSTSTVLSINYGLPIWREVKTENR